MSDRICPWWLAYTFDNPLRKLFQKPAQIIGPYIRDGMRVLDVGCGMGYYSIAMASMVGDSGRVLSIDLQQKMLDITIKRAKRAGVHESITPILCKVDNLGIDGRKVDFALAFWMVHEVPDQRGLLIQIRDALKPGGMFLMAEPVFHVSATDVVKSIRTAGELGLEYMDRPAIRFSRSALFRLT